MRLRTLAEVEAEIRRLEKADPYNAEGEITHGRWRRDLAHAMLWVLGVNEAPVSDHSLPPPAVKR